MNSCIYKGRIADELKLGVTNSGKKVLNLSIAIKRKRAGADGQDCDFLPCVAYEQTAELIVKYAKKGSRILLRCRNTSYNYEDKETKKIVYKTVSLVEEVDFIDFNSNDEVD